MIEIKDLRASYGDKEVIKDISLSFPEGKITVILGPNGSGKSTLFRLALGLMESTGGSVSYDGKDIKELSLEEIARKASYLSQSRNIPSINAERMVMHGRFPWLGWPRKYTANDRKIVREALRRTGAEKLRNENMKDLSGGERQKIYLAMAYAQDTRTVFMDEPTTYLDAEHQIATMKDAEFLKASGKAVVMVLHDLPLALTYADRIVVMEEGRIVEEGTPEEIAESGVIGRVFRVRLGSAETANGRRYWTEAL